MPGHAEAGHPGKTHLHRQDIGQGLPPASVPGHAQPPEARRSDLHHEHRQAGKKLQGNPAAVAPSHQGHEGGHSGPRHAPS